MLGARGRENFVYGPGHQGVNMAASRQLPPSLQWRQPSASHRVYELVSGDQVFASLRFVKALGTLAEVQANGATFSLKRVGFLHPKVTIRKTPFEQDIGTVEMSWRGTGTVTMSNGQRYVLKRASAWGGKWEVVDDANETLATTKMRRGFLRNEADVAVEEKGAKNGDLVLLLALGMYISILIQQDSAAAAGS
jgi:hypothetical protein